jgi:hypothetical protein
MSDHPKKENADAPASAAENTEKKTSEIQDQDLEKTAGGGEYWGGDDWNSEGS